MLNPAGVPSISVRLPSVPGVIAELSPGQTFQSVVQGHASNLWMNLGGVKVPLDPASGLMPGQTLSVQVAQNDSGVQLLVRQGPSVSPTASRLPAELPQLLASVLKALGAPISTEEAVYLTPSSLPHKAHALRTLFSLFTSRQPMGRDLQNLAGLLARAAQGGALPASVAADFSMLMSQILAGAPEDVLRALRQASRQASSSLEARLAVALRTGGMDALHQALGQDLRGLLLRIRADEGLASFLRDSGRLRDFLDTIDGLVERLAGRDMQNLRAYDHPYRFLDIPFAPDSPITNAQIHLWGRDRGGGTKREFDGSDVQAVLDLSMTRLGDLWITLSANAAHCACTIRSTLPEAVALLEESVPELTEALRQAGYPGATVRTGLWDGNRIRETAELMRLLSGVDMKA